MAKKPKTQTGTAAIRAIFLDAMEALNNRVEIVDPDPNLARDGIKPGQWPGAPHSDLPPGLPVTVLGKDGEITYIISATHDLHAVEKWDLTVITHLFAPYLNYALWCWPGWSKEKKHPVTGELIPPRVERVERDKCMQCLVNEASRINLRDGSFKLQKYVRGIGGWEANGRMIWHSGSRIWTVEQKLDPVTQRTSSSTLQVSGPTKFEGFFYKKDGETLTPWKTPIGHYESPAHKIAQDFRTWNWDRPYIDPLFLLGWLAPAFMGQAANHRPIVFVTGRRGSGKSELHSYVKELFGGTLFATANTTAAGIYQNIGVDSRPVAVDEFEARTHGDKEKAIMELARESYSGSEGYRGGANHEGFKFQMNSAFMLSGILPPPMGQQDKSRMTMLRLKALTAKGSKPVVDPLAGRMLLRQIIDGYHDFMVHLVPYWTKVLSRADFDPRAINTYGNLLAGAELLIGRAGMLDLGFDAADEDWIMDIVRFATKRELAEQTEKWQDVISRLLSSVIDQYKSGERWTVGRAIELYEKDILDLVTLRETLAMAGLGFWPRNKCGQSVGACLAVPFAHPALDKIFAGTDYHSGVWTAALRQGPEEIVPQQVEDRHFSIRINRDTKKCVLIDIDAYDAMHAARE